MPEGLNDTLIDDMQEMGGRDKGGSGRSNSTVSFEQWTRYYEQQSCAIESDEEFAALFDVWNVTKAYKEEYDKESEYLGIDETFDEAYDLYEPYI